MKLSILAGVATVSFLGALVACGSSSNKGGGETGDGGGGEGSVGGEGGGGEGGSSSKPYVGTVSAGVTIAGKTTTYTLSGVFVATSDAGAAAGGDGGAAPCLGTQSGSCCYTPPGALADAGAGGGDAGPTVSAVSAGTVSVKDGTTAVANMSPGTNNGYGIASTNNPSVTWKAGDTLAVSASGATVQAFSGNLQTVDDFAGVTPALSYTAATTVPIASNLAISWTAGNGTNVHVLIAAAKGTAGDGTITCTVADSAGTVSVPSALLGKLTTGDNGIISLTRTTVTTVTGPNATVGLGATSTTGGTAKFQ